MLSAHSLRSLTFDATICDAVLKRRHSVAGLFGQNGSHACSGCQSLACALLQVSSRSGFIHQSLSRQGGSLSSTCSRPCAAWLRASTASSSASSPAYSSAVRFTHAASAPWCSRPAEHSTCQQHAAHRFTVHQCELMGTLLTSGSLPEQKHSIMPRSLQFCGRDRQSGVGSTCRLGAIIG